MKLELTIGVLLTVLVLPACNRRDLNAVGEPGTPFVVLLSSSHGTTDTHVETLEQLLERETGLTVDIQVTPSRAVAVARCGTNKIDAAVLPLFDYLFCHQEYGVEAGLRVLRGERAETYAGEIVVRADSDIQDIKGLAGKKIAFVDRYSTAGFLLPAALLNEAGIEPESIFSGTHMAALADLRAGKADAAATYSGARGEDEDLRSIALTPRVPNEPVFFRPKLDPAKRQLITAALMKLAAGDEGLTVLPNVAGITGFKLVSDSDYRDVHGVIGTAGKRVQDLVPDGWTVHNENQRSLGEVFGP